MELLQQIVYIILSFIFLFIIVPYAFAYVAFIYASIFSGNTSIAFVFTKGLKAPFVKKGTLNIFMYIEVIIIIFFIIAIFKFLWF